MQSRMRSGEVDWKALVGRRLLINTYGVGCLLAVTEDHLVIGEGSDRGAIPLRVIRTVRVLAADGTPGPLLQVAGGDGQDG